LIPRLRWAAALMLALQGAAAGACGYCIEDKVAAVYDYAVVTKALGRSHHVAFFGIDGPLVAGKATQRELAAMVEATGGVDKGSARVSVESAALSFGFDPARAPLAKVIKALEASLAAKGLSLLPLQVMDRTLTGKK
jgi:hypothetical protein